MIPLQKVRQAARTSSLRHLQAFGARFLELLFLRWTNVTPQAQWHHLAVSGLTRYGFHAMKSVANLWSKHALGIFDPRLLTPEASKQAS